MDTSTPISTQREQRLIDLDDDSPIGVNVTNNSSEIYHTSDDRIQEVKNRAGMSNEINSMNVSPHKEFSPETVEKKPSAHSFIIAKASESNLLTPELKEEGDLVSEFN